MAIKRLISISIIFLLIILNGCIDEEKTVYKIRIEGKGNYQSIQHAIEEASNGDTIHVSKGIFNEKIIINESIHLIGMNEETIIQYRDNQSNINIVSINAEECSITGFKIIGNKELEDCKGIKIMSSDNIISENIIINTSDGIYLDRNTENNKIYNNKISNNENGILLIGSLDNEIHSNNISFNDEYNLYLYSYSNSNTVKKNTFLGGRYGVRIQISRYNRLFENRIINNKIIGLYICCSSEENHIYKNNFLDNNEHAKDSFDNYWYHNGNGNYWDDFLKQNPSAKDKEDDGIWDVSYNITGGKNKDKFPLVYPIDI